MDDVEEKRLEQEIRILEEKIGTAMSDRLILRKKLEEFEKCQALGKEG
ncbi:MAG: hypothetical protein QW078_01065 [Thermoplasmatales archaeon]